MGAGGSGREGCGRRRRRGGHSSGCSGSGGRASAPAPANFEFGPEATQLVPEGGVSGGDGLGVIVAGLRNSGGNCIGGGSYSGGNCIGRIV